MIAGVAWAKDDNNFYLKSGDTVVFYGDSITDQRLYTIIVETYVATRYPKLDVSFIDSGWGGDRVSGGEGGSIDTRLKRDVFAYHPSVVTVMLGMNDGGYKAETESNDAIYFAGYRHIVDSLHANLPQVRITAIQPSPYDDVTRTPSIPVAGGYQYNDVLRSFGKWIANYAPQAGIDVADMNTAVVSALTQAHDIDPVLAKEIIADHVHPGFAGHMVMAEQLVKAWKGRNVVSSVTIDASRPAIKVESAEFAKATELSTSGTIAWTELDDSLPLPYKQWEDMWGGGPTIGLILKSTDLISALNEQQLKVKGLSAGTYSLKIDGESVGAFNNDQLAAGINLALLKTPATEQAMKVYHLAASHQEVHVDWWRNVSMPLADYMLPEANAAVDAMTALDKTLAKKVREVAQPAPHKFELSPVQ
jgi:lysophospholipase L1-like esterase